mmetsp:Transcript_61480/g.127459  ORF Transcript_61480/g.127459 Transcript_61480/m.127459 type:complete len:218 (+) Transcript_61480:226-879(+)
MASNLVMFHVSTWEPMSPSLVKVYWMLPDHGSMRGRQGSFSVPPATYLAWMPPSTTTTSSRFRKLSDGSKSSANAWRYCARPVTALLGSTNRQSFAKIAAVRFPVRIYLPSPRSLRRMSASSAGLSPRLFAPSSGLSFHRKDHSNGLCTTGRSSARAAEPSIRLVKPPSPHLRRMDAPSNPGKGAKQVRAGSSIKQAAQGPPLRRCRGAISRRQEQT